MKSYRRLTVLGVFVALGVGLAICVGSSTGPSRTGVARSSSLARRSPTEAAGVSRPRDTEARATERRWSKPVQVLPPPSRSVLAGGDEAQSSDRTIPAYATPYPALAQDQAAASTSLISEADLELLKRQQGAVERIPPPPAQPATELPLPTAPQSNVGSDRNTITRTNGPQGDRFAINIYDADIREVLDLLSKQGSLNILASPRVKGKVSAALSDVELDSALDAILLASGLVAKREGQFIFVGTPSDFSFMDRSIDEINTRVYHPSYITSKELQNLIEPILTRGVGVISITSESKSGIPSEISDSGGDGYAGGDAILVRDYETVLREVDELVAEVALRPLQVHIEAMILSVQLNDDNKFGVDFLLLRQLSDTRFGWGSQIPVNKSNVPDLSALVFDGGLKYGFLDDTLGAFINALETIGDTNVIATPRLMVVNKHAAVIQIGKEEGYVNTTQTETAATQTVEMLELGTILRIRPFVSNDGMIRLEVHPEISDGSVTVEQGFTLPHKEITQVTTNIMIRDGCTAVIGGLIQDKQHVTRSQVPLLGSLPVVGVAFREKEEETIRHELIVLITPNVVREREAYREGVQQACEFQRQHAVYAEKMSPIGKRSIARKYVRRAQTAWAKGNRRYALRMAELAVHFDPDNREAIELRSDIWLGKPIEPPLGIQPDVLHPTGPLDGPQLPPWILKKLGESSSADSAPMGGGPPVAAGPPQVRPIPVSQIHGQTSGGQAAGTPGEGLPIAGYPNVNNTADPRPAQGAAELSLDPPGTLTVLPTPPGKRPAAGTPSSSP